MNKEEKETLRQEYNRLKDIYKLLKEDAKSVAPESQEMYEIRQNLSMVSWEMSEIRNRLIAATFERINPVRMIDNFFFKEETEQVRGGR